MNWDELEGSDIFAIFLLVIILVGAAFFYFDHPPYTPFSRGQGWECVRVPKGGLTCDQRNPSTSSAPR